MQMLGIKFRWVYLITFLIFIIGVNDAFALGQEAPEDWIFTSVSHYNSVDKNFLWDENTDPGGTAQVTTSDGTLTASPYSLHGFVTDSELGTTTFGDELFFVTDNGDPGELVFNFDVSIHLSVMDNNQPAEGLVLMYFYADHLLVDVAQLLLQGDSGNYSASFYKSDPDNPDQIWSGIESLEFNQTISFSTAGVTGDGGLVDSETYLPITFDFIAGWLEGNFLYETNNVSIDWLNSFTINPYNPVNVYQNNTLLSGNDYVLTSFQGDEYVNPIPEPSTMLLLGFPLIGFAGVKRRKLKK